MGNILAPNMNDATGMAYSEAIISDIRKKEETEDVYLITTTVDWDYLRDENRVYPVTVDPTVTWTGSSKIADPYVCNGSTYRDYNFYTSGVTVLSVGRSNSEGLYRNYMKFTDLNTTVKGYYVESAKLTLCETGGGASGSVVQAFGVNAAWNPSTITWNNRPGYYPASYSSITTKKTAGTTHTLDLTKHVRQVAAGEIDSNGIILCLSEQTAQGTYTQFYNSRAATVANRPKLTVVYYDPPTQASSVSVSPVYLKPGTKVTATWSGITSKSLNRVEYLLSYYDDSTGERSGTAVAYDASRSLGAKGAGSAVVPGSNAWAEGCYKMYLRGVDNGGISGVSRGTLVHVDGTAPVIKSASISPTVYTTSQTPVLTWNISDDHLSMVQYRVNEGAFVDFATIPSGSFTLPAAYFPSSGTYTVGIRALDKAGNVSAVKNLTYLVDRTGPVGTITSTPQAGTWTDVNPVINFTNVSDTQSGMVPSQVQYCLTGEGQAAGAFKAVNGFTLTSAASPYAGRFTIDAADQAKPDGKYTIYTRFKDNVGNTSTQQLSYKKDKEKPTGTISISGFEQNLTDTIQVTTSLSDGTGSGIKNSTLTVKNASGNIVETIYDNFTTTAVSRPLNTRNLANGNYYMELTVSDNANHTSVITKNITIKNTLEAPLLTGSNRNDGKAYLSWSLTTGINSLSAMEYQLQGQTLWNRIPSSWQVKGSYVFYLPSDEKTYRIKVRGIDGSGMPGEVSEIDCTYDKTKPDAEIFSMNQGIVRGTVNDTWLSSWKVEVKDKNEPDIQYKKVLGGTNKLENASLGVIDIAGSGYLSGHTYVFRLTAVDIAQNVSEYCYYYTKQNGDVTAEEVKPQFVLDKPGSMNKEEGCYVLPMNTNYLELDTLQDISQNSFTWYVSNKKISAANYHTGNNAILDFYKIKSGIKEKKKFSISAVQKSSNGSILYSSKLVKNEICENVLDGNLQMNSTIKSSSGISLNSTSLNGNVTKTVELQKPLAEFTLSGNSQFSQDASIRYYLQNEDGSWKEILVQTHYRVADIFPDKLTVDKLIIKAEISRKSLGAVPEITKLVLWGDTLEEEKYYLWEMENYLPVFVSAVSKLNYKTYLTWNRLQEKTSENITKKQDVKLPEDVSYEIYRSTNINDLKNMNIAQITNINNDYYSEINVNYGREFYYRVRAVREKKNAATGKTEKAYSSFSDIISTTIVDGDEYTKLLGYKSYWDYETFANPNGTGYVEKSRGNFVYAQTDAVIENERLPISLNRSYNSQASTVSSFGKGWNHVYDVELLNINETNQLIDRKAFRDETGTIFLFEKQKDGTYASSMGKYITLKQEELKEQIELPNRNGNDKITKELCSSYTMLTKDNLEYRFNSGGQLIYLKEPNGSFVLLTYDIQTGRLVSAATNQNLVIKFSYEEDAKKKSDQIIEDALDALKTKKVETKTINEDMDEEELTVVEMDRVSKGAAAGTDVSVEDAVTNLLLVRKITLPDGTELEYEFDKENKLNSVNRMDGKAGGKSISYEYLYDLEGNLSLIKDAKKNPYKIVYQDKRVKEIIYPSVSSNQESVRFTYQNISEGQNVYSTLIQKGLNGEYGPGEFIKSSRAGNVLYRKDIQRVESFYTYEDNLLKTTSTDVDYQELENGRVVTKTDRSTKETAYDPDQNMNPVSAIDSENQKTEYTYGDQSSELVDDRPTRIVDTSEDEIISDERFEYDDLGNEVEEEDMMNGDILMLTYYGEDSEFSGEEKESIEKSKVIGENGEENFVTMTTVYKYSYDQNGIKTETITETLGDEVTTSINKFDAMGRQFYSDEGDGTVTTVEYDYLGRKISSTENKNGKTEKTVMEYDPNGTLIKEIEEDGTQKVYEYDQKNRLIKTSTQKGSKIKTQATVYSYEWQMNKYGEQELIYIKKNVSPGGLCTYNYQNQLGWSIKQISNGLMTWTDFDRNGKAVVCHTGLSDGTSEKAVVVNVNDVTGSVTATIMNPDYERISKSWKITDKSVVTYSTYDGQGNVSSFTDGEGNTVRYNYDIYGVLTEVHRNDGTGTDNVTSFQNSILEPDGTTSSRTIDAMGNLSKDIFDDKGRKVRTTDLGNGKVQPVTTDFTYDEQGNLFRETYGDSSFKEYRYDEKKRLVKSTSYRADKAADTETSYTYSGTDKVLTMEDFKFENGQKVRFRYTAYNYDEQDQLAGVSEYDGTDIPDRVKLENSRITYSYNEDGQLIAVGYPNIRQGDVKGLEYGYDVNGRRISITAVMKNGNKHTLTNYTYLPTGELVTEKVYRKFADGNTQDYIIKKYTYDELSRPKRIEYLDSSSPETVKEYYEYTYNKNSQILSETIYNDYPDKGEEKVYEVRSYTYNPLGSLIHVKIQDKKNNAVTERSYSYDKVGNRVKEVDQDKETVYSYNSLNQLVEAHQKKDNSELSNRTYIYDGRGNLSKESEAITGSVLEYFYDIDNRIEKQQIHQNGKTLTVQENKYNGNGQRIQKKEDNQVTNYYYQDSNVYASTNGGGELKSINFLAGTNDVVATERFGEKSSDKYFFYNQDYRNSTSTILDTQGMAVQSYRYNDFGETIINGNKEFLNEICYTGGIYDQATGQYYLNARYYDPSDGRFMTQDTYRGENKRPETLHLYAYCQNNPVNMADPSGHKQGYIRSQTYDTIVDGQRMGDIKVGVFGNVAANGCGAIAVYNVLYSRGYRGPFYLINNTLEVTPYNAAGVLGTSPISIFSLLDQLHPDVYLSALGFGWRFVAKLSRSVVTLYLTGLIPPGAHYVAGIRTQKGRGKRFRFYNVGIPEYEGKCMTISRYISVLRSRAYKRLEMIGVG